MAFSFVVIVALLVFGIVSSFIDMVKGPRGGVPVSELGWDGLLEYTDSMLLRDEALLNSRLDSLEMENAQPDKE